jgi:hypothetical protein
VPESLSESDDCDWLDPDSEESLESLLDWLEPELDVPDDELLESELDSDSLLED